MSQVIINKLVLNPHKKIEKSQNGNCKTYKLVYRPQSKSKTPFGTLAFVCAIALDVEKLDKLYEKYNFKNTKIS